jgi:hypothetical protein
MLGLGGEQHKLGYRRLSFVPVRDTGQQAAPGNLVPLNPAASDGPAGGEGATMPGLRPRSEAEAVLAANGGKIKEFCKESSITLRWTTVRRAVSSDPGHGTRRLRRLLLLLLLALLALLARSGATSLGPTPAPAPGRPAPCPNTHRVSASSTWATRAS